MFYKINKRYKIISQLKLILLLFFGFVISVFLWIAFGITLYKKIKEFMDTSKNESKLV